MPDTDAHFDKIDARLERIAARLELVDAHYERIDAGYERLIAANATTNRKLDTIIELLALPRPPEPPRLHNR